MKVHVGRFEGYISDKNPTDIVLALLSRVVGRERQKIDPSRVQSYVYDMKQQYPSLLSDVYFSETSFFPHSEEVDQAMHTLQCAGYIVRPNPKFASFTMEIRNPIDAEWMSPEDKAHIEEYAKTLLKDLT